MSRGGGDFQPVHADELVIFISISVKSRNCLLCRSTSVHSSLSGVSVVHFVHLHPFTFLLIFFFFFPPRFLRIACHQFYLFCRGSMFYSCCFIWCPIRFPWNIMFVSFNSNTAGATSGVATAYPHSWVLEFIPRFLVGVVLPNL